MFWFSIEAAILQETWNLEIQITDTMFTESLKHTFSDPFGWNFLFLGNNIRKKENLLSQGTFKLKDPETLLVSD